MKRFVLLALSLPALLAAHEMTVRVETGASAVIVRTSYGGEGFAGRADVEIFEPGDEDSPYQTGLTDASGVFAFVPSEPGRWLAVVDDGFGHRAEAAVEWGEAAGAQAPQPAHAANWRDALTGVSLLIGLTGIWLWFQSRKSPQPR